jgi:hypothetical protein
MIRIAISALTPRWLNTVGLVLGMLGVVIVFIWGPPQPDLDPHGKLLLNQEDEATQQLEGRYEIMSRVGLGLIGAGFAVQLVAVWR